MDISCVGRFENDGCNEVGNAKARNKEKWVSALREVKYKLKSP